MLSGDSVFWSRDGEVFRAPKDGGDPELIGTTEGEWTISGQDLVATGPANEPAPVIRTPIGGGPSEEILPLDPETYVRTLVPLGDGILVQRSRDLLLIPASGAPLFLAEGTATGGGSPVAAGGFAYFGATDPLDFGKGPRLQRVSISGGEAAEILLDGFPVAIAVAGDTLYTNVVLRRPDHTFVGTLVHLPASGGAATAMALTDASSEPASPNSWGAYQHKTGGLQAGAERVYFFELCTEIEWAEYRLVSLPVDHVLSL